LSPVRRGVAAHVRSVLPSTLALSFHIALVFLRASAALLQGAYLHTEKHMRGQRMRQKIASREGRASSVFTPRPLAGAPCFREIYRIAWCAQVSLQSVRHRSGCEARKSVSATRQCHSGLGIRSRPLRMLRVVTSRLARARQVRSQEGGGQAGLRWRIECTQRQFLGSAKTSISVVVVPTPMGPMERSEEHIADTWHGCHPKPVF